MYTVESTHAKVEEKFAAAKNGLHALGSLRNLASQNYINIYLDELETAHDDYLLAVAPALGEYYCQSAQPLAMHKHRQDYCNLSDSGTSGATNYYRVLAAGNHVAVADRYISRVISLASAARFDTPAIAAARDAAAIPRTYTLERKSYEICKCGTRMDVKPEHSILECPQCGRIKELAGTVFRDDQFQPADGQKTKHGGYDTLRHYKFHIERLQGLENMSFDDDVIDRIEQVMNADKISKRVLDCEKMRQILRDSRVYSVSKTGVIIKGTKFNDHAPLLVKLCGGQAPPLLTFKENQLASLRFSKIMALYDQVVPSGNKPYYPYFMLKIFEHMFKDDPDKLRIIDYIHLQSRDTVIKHDKTYEQICALADPADGLVYTPTLRSTFRA